MQGGGGGVNPQGRVEKGKLTTLYNKIKIIDKQNIDIKITCTKKITN